MTQVFEAFGQHGRFISVKLETSKCFECDEQKECLLLDSSDEEYSIMKFCQTCLDGFFEGHISKSNWLNNKNVDQD